MLHDQQGSSDTCSFLSLPADIRLENYKLVLGGKTIHFNDYFAELGNHGLFLYRASFTDLAFFGNSEHLKVIQFAGVEIEKCLRSRHKICYRDWAGLQVSLLRVCRLF